MDIELVRASFKAVTPHASRFADLFFDALFEVDPGLERLLPDDLVAPKKAFVKQVAFAVYHLESEQEIVNHFLELGRSHPRSGMQSSHLPAVGQCLLQVLRELFGKNWTDQLETSWDKAYHHIATIITQGLNERNEMVTESGATENHETGNVTEIAPVPSESTKTQETTPDLLNDEISAKIKDLSNQILRDAIAEQVGKPDIQQYVAEVAAELIRGKLKEIFVSELAKTQNGSKV